jgi:hypothetical protein
MLVACTVSAVQAKYWWTAISLLLIVAIRDTLYFLIGMRKPQTLVKPYWGRITAVVVSWVVIIPLAVYIATRIWASVSVILNASSSLV